MRSGDRGMRVGFAILARQCEAILVQARILISTQALDEAPIIIKVRVVEARKISAADDRPRVARLNNPDTGGERDCGNRARTLHRAEREHKQDQALPAEAEEGFMALAFLLFAR